MKYKQIRSRRSISATAEFGLKSTVAHRGVDAKALAESTTRFDGRRRPEASTAWLVPLGAVDVEAPPIAGLGDVAQADGNTTQYLYDDNLSDGAGLDHATGLSFNKMAASGTSSVSLTTALSKLAAVPASGGAGISFSSTAPGRASVVISPNDGAGCTIQSTDKLAKATNFTYDDGGRLVTDAYNRTVTESRTYI